jgi:phage head maturation protease
VTEIERLFDVSIVAQPAYPQTSATMRSRDARRERKAALLKRAEASLAKARAER